MLKPVFLTAQFYADYSTCSEIEQKSNRPYVCVKIEIDGVQWAIPMRSHISHNYAVWTDKENHCGIDLTKAVVLEKPAEYISKVQPHIRKNEFDVLKRINKSTVEQKLRQYIKDYKKAKAAPDAAHNKRLLSFSTLQYFEQYL